VLAGLPPVFFTLPGEVGFLVVGLIGAFAGASYLLGSRAVRAGKPLPMSLTERARRGFKANVAKRRGDTAEQGLQRPRPNNTPPPRPPSRPPATRRPTR
jgi:hypothetical protein